MSWHPRVVSSLQEDAKSTGTQSKCLKENIGQIKTEQCVYGAIVKMIPT